jgi:hypothetical protein
MCVSLEKLVEEQEKEGNTPKNNKQVPEGRGRHPG